VHAEQASRISRRLATFTDPPDNLSLLLTIELWRSPLASAILSKVRASVSLKYTAKF
jgi:hypothetical protein